MNDLQKEVERLRAAAQLALAEMYQAACCIQAMKDGNDNESTFDRLRALRHSFFGERGAGLALKEALQTPPTPATYLNPRSHDPKERSKPPEDGL